MRLFKRNSSQNTDASSQVTDYYQSEKSGRKPVAWLLALGTFIVTLVIILGVFFVGKWGYHKFTNRNKSNQQAQTTGTSNTTDTSRQASDNNSSTPTSNSAADQNTSAPQTSSTSTSTPSGPAANSPAATPPSRLVNTGPDEDL